MISRHSGQNYGQTKWVQPPFFAQRKLALREVAFEWSHQVRIERSGAKVLISGCIFGVARRHLQRSTRDHSPLRQVNQTQRLADSSGILAACSLEAESIGQHGLQPQGQEQASWLGLDLGLLMELEHLMCLCKLPLPSSSDEAVDSICWVMREFEQKITSKAHGHSRPFMSTTNGLLLLGNGIQE